MSDGVDQANPQSAEPSVKSTNETTNMRLLPKRSTTQPLIGMTRARANR